MTITDVVKECAIDRSRVVVHIRPFKLLKTLYGSCFRLARKPAPINSERRKYYYDSIRFLLPMAAALPAVMVAVPPYFFLFRN